MKRLLLSAALLTASTVALSSNLWAHGGQFRGPGGQVPPSMREPTDPTPPPPPPPSGAPPTAPPPSTTPGSGAPPPTVPPPTTPVPSTPTVPDAGSPGGGRKTPQSFENWIFWYENNKEDLERLKEAIYSRITSDNPMAVLGGSRDAGGQQGGATQSTATKIETHIIPALKWAMNPENSGHQDTESAAYIALAKMTKDPLDIELIKQGLATDHKGKRDLITQESAALALGLLRRAETAKQFPAADLDKVRSFLFGVIENDKDYAAGARSFAAMAIGLLGDQPCGSGEYANDIQAAQKAVTNRLWELVQGKHVDENIPVALLMGLGMQSKTSVSEEIQTQLAEATLRGKLGKADVSDMVRSYAALQLGRIGGPAAIRPMVNALTGRGVDRQTQRSVAIGLGLLGRLVPVENRLEIAKALKEGGEKAGDNSVKNFALISLAYLVNKDIEEGRTDVLEAGKAGEYLLAQAKDGNFVQRPFGAIALALVGRRIDDTNAIKAYQDFKQASVLALREGLASQKLDKRSRAGFATALGIIQDIYSRKNLVAILSDSKEDRELRGYAAIALGLIRTPTDEVRKALRSALDERSSEEMRQQCATALGLLEDPGAVDVLLVALKEAESQNLKGQIVLALARIGDARAVEPLVDLLKNKKEGDLTRALACAGLGVVGDLENLPSLTRISKDINYRASIYYINEVLSIL